jgi:hypothetical protein
LNERIREVWIKAAREDSDPDNWDTQVQFIERFAELIVKECAGLCDQAAEENARTFYTVTETQEVGPALVAKGSQVQAEKLSQQIKQHFGVEK